jgi:short subunit dehydrogenase-like uncharacterized protein
MSIASAKRPYDVVLWGSTGYTGRLCAEYLARQYTAAAKTGSKHALNWAIAGRSLARLEEVRLNICVKLKLKTNSIHILVADIGDAASMDAMAAQTKVIISAAGPFARVGMPVVDACVRNGCDYCDITGEPNYVRKVIDKHHDAAQKKKLKLVPCCGFDCIPVDIGCSFMVGEMRRRGWVPREVKTTLRESQGGASGGTLLSLAGVLASSGLRELRQLLSPYYLMPRASGGDPIEPPSREVRAAAGDKIWFHYDPALKKWCVPFVMQSIDCRVVNRSNAIGGSDDDNWKYGKDFVYTEDMAMPNFVVALSVTIISHLFTILMYGNLTRAMIMYFLPKSGEGPSEIDRKEGFFFFHSEGKGLDPQTGDVHSLVGRFNGPNGDGGYQQTSAMLAEAGVCLALDREDTTAHSSTPAPAPAELYGVLTPSTAFGTSFVDRLRESPGIIFELE